MRLTFHGNAVSWRRAVGLASAERHEARVYRVAARRIKVSRPVWGDAVDATLSTRRKNAWIAACDRASRVLQHRITQFAR